MALGTAVTALGLPQPGHPAQQGTGGAWQVPHSSGAGKQAAPRQGRREGRRQGAVSQRSQAGINKREQSIRLVAPDRLGHSR